MKGRTPAPDGKSQVTLEYRNVTPARVDTVVISAQHAPDIEQETIHADILHHVIRAVIPERLLNANTRVFINPTGRFVVGGPHGDTGLTGRKIIADTFSYQTSRK